MVDEDEAEPEGSDDKDEGGPGLLSRAAPAMGVLLLALIVAVASGAGSYVVNRHTSTDDHANEAQATARVYLPEYVKARDGLTAMKNAAGLRLPLRHEHPNARPQGAGLRGEHAVKGAIAAAQTKLHDVCPQTRARRAAARRCNGAGSAARRSGVRWRTR